jgi:hypothetical protein
MASKHKKKAAAWARTTRQAGTSNISSLSVPSSPNEEPLLSQPAVPVENDAESNWDCGYTGGVNCLVSDLESSDSEYEPDSDEWSDDGSDESLEELEQIDLERNLDELRAEATALHMLTKYKELTRGKIGGELKKATQKWGMGYTGTSECTKQHDAKVVRNCTASQQEACTLWVSCTEICRKTLTCFPVLIHKLP